MVDMGIIQFNEEHMRSLFERGQEFVSVVRGSADGTGGRRLQKVLFHGVPGTGKTALAAQIAIDSKYDFIKVVKPYDLVAFGSELARADYIKKVFADAHKSKLSLLILDDLEDLIDWTPIGPRFSNTILSTVMTLIRQPPPDVSTRDSFVSLEAY
jgi:vesicle-fusing ATPase